MHAVAACNHGEQRSDRRGIGGCRGIRSGAINSILILMTHTIRVSVSVSHGVGGNSSGACACYCL